MTYDYERDTRQAYRNMQKAQAYENFHTRGLNWGRFSSWRERAIVHGALAACGLSPRAKILDIPSGTGILGGILQQFPNPVVAADISLEMMELSREKYAFPHFIGFVQADITRTPFGPGDFDSIIIMGLMHRLPRGFRQRVLAEVSALKPKYTIISYSLDNSWQRLKQRLLKRLKPSHSPAPAPAAYRDIVRELEAFGFKVKRSYHTVPLLSTEIVFALERQN